MRKDGLLVSLTVVLLVVGVGMIGSVLFNNFNLRKSQKQGTSADCTTSKVREVMNDEFMPGILEKGETFKVIKNYYNCHPIQRGDLVWFRVSAPVAPVVKTVYGVPGDRFQVIRDTVNHRRWLIRINDEWVTGYDGKPFFIESDVAPPLKSYESTHGGYLKAGEYIIFSNVAPGLADSSNLGLVRRRSFEGKVLLLTER